MTENGSSCVIKLARHLFPTGWAVKMDYATGSVSLFSIFVNPFSQTQVREAEAISPPTQNQQICKSTLYLGRTIKYSTRLHPRAVFATRPHPLVLYFIVQHSCFSDYLSKLKYRAGIFWNVTFHLIGVNATV